MADDKNKQVTKVQLSVEERLAKLEATNAELTAENARLKSQVGTGSVSVLKSYGDHQMDNQRAEARAKQTAIREKAYKAGDGMAEYIVGEAGGYYGGRLYANGERVRIKDTELPSVTWKPAPAPPPKAEAEEAVAPKAKQTPRAADTEV